MTDIRNLSAQFHDRLFDAIYSRSLVYNSCWEDPAVDRLALSLRTHDTLLVISSAGCNVLDYALTGPRRIDAVDANPRQTALLELKIAGIRRLDHGDYFAIFGQGVHPRFRELYHDALRGELSPFACWFWDRRLHWFAPGAKLDGFYYHGLAGIVARAFRRYRDLNPRLRTSIEELLETQDLDEQREIYDRRVAPHLWNRSVKWALSRQITMSMLGVPHAQHEEVRRQHAGGTPGFVRDAIEYVFRQIPLWTNYFWQLYLRGTYSPASCPEYLKPRHFKALKNGLVNRVHTHTCTVTEFLQRLQYRISKYVLLDHMDWMSSGHPAALSEEWVAILARATPDARVIFRSAHADPAYLKTLSVPVAGKRRRLGELLEYHPALARELTRLDRVHTYAGFHIADIKT